MTGPHDTSPIRPLIYDVSHLNHRLGLTAGAGMDRVDAAFAAHFAAQTGTLGLHYGWPGPRVVARGDVERLARTAAAKGDDAGPGNGPVLEQIGRWLTGDTPGLRRIVAPPRRGNGFQGGDWRRRLGGARLLLPRLQRVPSDAVYLNVAQAALEIPAFFTWLDRRPDVAPVFMVHDVLPLTHPEYFPAGYAAIFRRRMATVARHARALIVTSNAGSTSIAAEFSALGRGDMPMWTGPLPSSFAAVRAASPSGTVAPMTLGSGMPYFVVLGTIEPRKNHLLLLNIWRQWVLSGITPPKLLIIGKRGWENEQTLDVLDRGAAARGHVLEISGLADAALAVVLRHATAVLMPSFCEGYGLPIVEALTMGTPVVVSDIAVFRECAQGCARLLHPLDGPGWRQAVLELAADAASARGMAAGFRAPDWSRYFTGLEAFLAGV